jgi:hypothetical protein
MSMQNFSFLACTQTDLDTFLTIFEELINFNWFTRTLFVISTAESFIFEENSRIFQENSSEFQKFPNLSMQFYI